MRLADVALARIATLGAERLAALDAPETCRALSDLSRAEHDLGAALDALAATAQAHVRGLEDRALRRALIELARDAHNGRVERVARAARETLPPDVSRALDAATALGQEAARTRAAAASRYEAECERVTSTLRAAAGDPAVQDIVASASPSFARELPELAEGRLTGKRLRQAEATLAQYLARASVKTSPFAELCLVAAARLTSTPAAQRAAAGDDQPNFTLNIAWIDVFAELSRLAGEAPLAPVTYTLNARDNAVFVRRDEALRKDVPRLQGAAESIVEVAGVAAALARVRDAGPCRNPAELCAALGRLGVAAPEEMVAKLEQVGALRAAPPLPMHAWWDLGAVADALAARGPRSTELASTLRSVARSLDQAAAQPARARLPALDDVARTLRGAAVAAGGRDAPTPAPALFEDRMARGFAAELGYAPLRPALEDLGRVLRVMASASPRYARRRTIAERARRLFGDRPVPLLELCAALLREEKRARADGGEDHAGANPLALPDVTRHDEVRRGLLAALRGRAARDADGNIDLSIDALEDAWRAQWPEPCRALVAAHVQIDSIRAPARLVLNHALPGGGKLFSRFLRGVDADGAVVSSLRAHVASAVDGVPAEIGAVQGFNGNLHPPIVPAGVDYPGTPSLTGAWTRLPIERLVAAVEGSPGELVVRDGAGGPRVALLDLGFLSEALTPPLQRLLGELGPQGAPDASVLRVASRETGVAGVTCRPRLTVGHVVVSRRTLVLDLAALEVPRDPFEAFVYLRALARRAGIPEVFYGRRRRSAPRRPSADVPAAPRPDGGALSPSTGGEAPRADARRSGPAAADPAPVFDAKPMWIDLRSPVYARILARMLAAGEGHAEIAEPLPFTPEDGLLVDGERRAAEWLLEYALDDAPLRDVVPHVSSFPTPQR